MFRGENYVMRTVLFLTSPKFLLLYVGVGMLFFLLLLFLPSFANCVNMSDAFYITLGLLTGGDPFTFKEKLGISNLAWGWAWLIHVSSWLIIPIIVGFLFSREIQRIQAQTRRTLRRSLEALGKAQRLSDSEAKNFAKQAIEELERED